MRGSRRDARAQLLATAGENAHLLPLVVDLLNAFGWRFYHVTDARKDVDKGKRASCKGFLDILALRGSRLVILELKDEQNDLSDEQREWFRAWQEFGHAEVYVVRPRDGDALEDILT